MIFKIKNLKLRNKNSFTNRSLHKKQTLTKVSKPSEGILVLISPPFPSARGLSRGLISFGGGFFTLPMNHYNLFIHRMSLIILLNTG
ncbi:MAG: hypothetical protein RO257_02615 [Candidatus Kapabacteria bacterium]|nr:hypothetical protein [Candidatus Kapabacteria bacterium]